ncbi:MAG: RluA family pseudouridine synthase [Phycisphaerae bacterium]|nr:RluA family pseudouridine synthase [Phycisphaerae bacterium]
MDELQDLRGRPVTLHVGVGISERRLDKYLHGRFRNLSRHFLQDAIRAGGITVNSKPAKPSLKLQHGDVIQMVIPEPPSKEITPEDIPLDILYEDDDVIILNKQADLIVHPARGNKSGTLVNALVHYSDQLSSGLGEFRPGIVHRLDRNTTGVMIVTKHEAAQWKIAKQFEDRQTQKTYLAIVHGTPDLDADKIDAPLAVHPQIREKYAVRPEIGKEAVTYYEVLEAFRGFSLLKLSPKTGRTHQIRVHLSHIKHPIVADDMYGGKLVYPWQLADAEQAVEEPVIARCALHAFSIEFRHPTTNEMVRFEAPLPADMQHLLDMLRQYRTQ